jgi:signal transduction histidine kinase/CheY-like chemotaxis protein
MNISSLREFIVSAPICGETDSLAAIWQLFQRAGTDQIVVVDEQQVPFGVLKLSRFVAVFSIGNSLPPVQLQLQQSSLIAHYALIDPVLVLWADGDLAQVQPHLDELTQQAIVLVDSRGQYVGLLDRLQVLHHLASGGQTAVKPSSRSASTDAAFPDPLIDLLERLPLPLMLQTSAGRVITQNLAWRQRVGGIQHPQRIRRAAARILEASLACRTDAKPRFRMDAPLGLQPPTISLLDQRLFSSTQAPSVAASVGGVCQLGTEPNTCVCICPMKDGQERVWQFIKVPMGMANALAGYRSGSDLDAGIASWQHQVVGQSALLPFKLASLKFSPDPNWRTLMQTETLWLVLAQDMTEQQQVAKELAAKNADLIQLNRLKDEFLACISHELKTPLTAVLGMSSLLKDQLLGDLNERQSHYAQLIYRSGRHLIAIINNILDLTRIETGQLELLLEQVHIPTICQQAYELAQQQHSVENSADPASQPEPELHFQLDIHPTLQYIVADELRLRQMLINLLSNAIKFTEPGGNIGLRVEPWEGWITFMVWDTGIGIPAEKQHLVFQKFQQLEQPLTRQFRGTGLGLVLTQRLARLHGGDVSFTSVPNQGSQFTLLLPPVPPQATESDFDLAAPTSLSASASDRNRLVLIVEADAERLDERVEQLTELGYRVIIARAGTEAIEKARRLQPTAILLNPLLPLLSGWDVLKLLKTDETTCNIPIVVTAVRVEKDQAYQNGADGFLNLPVDTDVLERCLKRLVQPPAPKQFDPVADITVLHLYEGSPSFTLVSNQHHCRVLEVDDLEQADLLARVWKPDVVLIDHVETEVHSFMQQLSQASSLADLPLITLTAELTRAANQIPGLAVFPYLAMIAASEGDVPPQPDTSELMQIMQLAAGVNWVPNILIVDCGAIDPDQSASGSTASRPPVRALVQYLQTAGFRSAVSNSWEKVQQALQHQSVDLLLFCVAPTESSAIVAQMVQSLQQLPHQPPVLVWNYQTQTAINASEARLEAPLSESLGMSQWSQVATRILPASLSILELLAQINQALAERRRQQLRDAQS